MPKVKSFKSVGMQQAYDLEVGHPDHQFYLANGLLTSNSHAVSYAIDSYMCAWLLTYFEPEWLCAYMETQDGQPEKRAEAIGELKSFGYEIVKVDINHATDEWTIMPGKKFMPSFSTVKGVGAAAIEEIDENRKVLPDRMYKTVEQLLWKPDGSWRHSKFNKRAFENLIKICAFDSMDIVGPDKPFSSYQHMWKCLIEDNAKIKHKKHGKAELERRIKDLRCEEWSKNTLIRNAKELVGSGDLNLIVFPETRDYFETKKLLSIDDFDKPAEYWFIIDELVKKTTKNGKQYALLTVMGLSGKKHKMFCWGFQDKHEKYMPINDLYKAVVSASQFGFAANISTISRVDQSKLRSAYAVK